MDIKTWIVYKITNLINNKIYVGKADNLPKRWKEHCQNAKSSKLHFHRSIKKHGKEKFDPQILATVTSEQDAFELEKFWIAKLKTLDPTIGYNMTMGGEGGDTSFYPEAREKMRGALGRPRTEEEKAAISRAHTGKPHIGYKLIGKGWQHRSEKTRQQMSLSHMGIIPWNKGIPAWNKGIPSGALGKTNVDKFGEDKAKEISSKISKALKGKPSKTKGRKKTFSEEHKQNMLLAQRNRREREKKEKEFLLGVAPVSPPEPITIN